MLRTILRLKLCSIANLPLLGIALICGSVTASAQDAVVGTCNPSIPSYDELQDAVDGVPNGGVVAVCPGKWAQQVRITKSLSLMGVQSGNNALPVIVPPVGGLVQNAIGLTVGGFMHGKRIAAQILVTPGITVDISNLALDATGGVASCSPANDALAPVGIYFQQASGSVTHVAAKNQSNTCVGPQGDGVLVQNGSVPSKTVTVQSSSFRNFGWMAVEASANTAGATVTYDGNTLVGPGATDGNGLWVSYGAGGTISNNSISDALRTGDATGFWGIIGVCPSRLTVSNNMIGNTDTGIAIINNPSNCGAVYGAAGDMITNNQVFDSATVGIQVCGSKNTVQNNNFNDSIVAAIDLNQGCNSNLNIATQNTVNGTCAAVLAGTDALLNLIALNDVFNAKNLLASGPSCTGGFSPVLLQPGLTKPLPPGQPY